MNKLIMGFEMPGYNVIKLGEDVNVASNDSLLLVLRDNEDLDIKSIYTYILDKIRECKVMLVEVGTEYDRFKPLECLMTSFCNYNIYRVEDTSILNTDYVDRLWQRKPTFNEIQTFIDSDVAAFSELSTIMFGIENLVREGNIEAINSFIEQRVRSVESLTSVIDYMKSICAIHNTSELCDKIKELESSIETFKVADREKESTINKLEDSNKKLLEIANEAETLKAKLKQAEEREASSGSIYTDFVPCNTATIKCKPKSIMYFKEVSYVTYMNSLIKNLMNRLSTAKLKVKLLIYDNKTEYYQVYSPHNVVDGKSYTANKDRLLALETKCIVVTEPVQMIINDILTSNNDYDVIIIYDRMRTTKDVVIGNNVCKFFVINSNNDYTNTCKSLNITDESRIITRSDATFSKEALDIPFIEGYTTGSESARIMKYTKLVTNIKKVNLLKEIMNKARIAV